MTKSIAQQSGEMTAYGVVLVAVCVLVGASIFILLVNAFINWYTKEEDDDGDDREEDDAHS